MWTKKAQQLLPAKDKVQQDYVGINKINETDMPNVMDNSMQR